MMPLLVSDQRTEEWHAARVGRITASLGAACLGLDPHTSRAEAWRQVLGKKLEENSFMRWGTEQEKTAKLAYEVETGVLLEETGFWIHPLHDWLGASPDAFAGDDGIAEFKCPAKLPDAVPIKTLIQILIQLAVTGRKWGDYVAWTPRGIYIERVHAKGLVGLVNKLHAFYQQYVVTEVCPPRKKRRRRKGAK